MYAYETLQALNSDPEINRAHRTRRVHPEILEALRRGVGLSEDEDQESLVLRRRA